MSKVTIVVPIYNAGKKLEKCINSILDQTFKDFELVLVNDGSKDKSLDICRKYQKKDNRIVVIDKENEGSIQTRRKGVQVANSDYVMFVDADDWIDRTMIERLYKETYNDLVDITVCNMYKVLGNGWIKKKNASVYFEGDKIYSLEEIKTKLVTAYFFGHPFPPSLCAKLYKRDLLLSSGTYLNRISFLGDDLFYNLEILLKARKVKVISEPLYYYRVGGFTSKYMPKLFDDIVNGYQIQKEVIDEYYIDTRQEQYEGISIMLLNTFKTCLYNLFKSKLTEIEIKQLISDYIINDCVNECTTNKGSIRYFPSKYLSAINNKDIDYLYNIGKSMYKRNIPKTALIQLASKLSII